VRWHLIVDGSFQDARQLRSGATGMAIGRGDVCRIQTVDTKPAGIGGGRHHFLGVSAASVAAPAPTPVPTLGLWALLALAGLTGEARLARPPHREHRRQGFDPQQIQRLTIDKMALAHGAAGDTACRRALFQPVHGDTRKHSLGSSMADWGASAATCRPSRVGAEQRRSAHCPGCG